MSRLLCVNLRQVAILVHLSWHGPVQPECKS